MSKLVKSNGLVPNVITKLWDAEKALLSDFFDMDGSLFKWNQRVDVPSVNVVENANDFQIEMAAPGKNRDDFKVEIEDGYLKISCEKEEKKEESHRDYRRKEFSYDFFSRSLLLPDNCVPEKLTAKYDNGILHLHLPKKVSDAEKPKTKIKVM